MCLARALICFRAAIGSPVMMGRTFTVGVKERDVWKIVLFQKLWLVVVMLVATTGFAQSLEIKGVRFSDTLVVEQTELKLNGVAVLKWAMLCEVYAGALYLPAGFRGQAWSNDVAKRLELSYFREIEAKGFAEASDKILQDNLLPAEYQTLAKRLRTFMACFRM